MLLSTGRGRQVIAVARTCNLIFIVLDVLKPLQQKKLIEHELEGFGIRCNKKPPPIVFKKKEKGGINMTSSCTESVYLYNYPLHTHTHTPRRARTHPHTSVYHVFYFLETRNRHLLVVCLGLIYFRLSLNMIFVHSVVFSWMRWWVCFSMLTFAN